MLLHGGRTSGASLGDLWELSLGEAPAWHSLAGNTSSGARDNHCAVLDPPADRLVIFGGLTVSGSNPVSAKNDTWGTALATNVTTQLTAVPPPTRYGGPRIYDPVGKRMLVFGGASGGALGNDVWSLDLGFPSQWTKVVPTGTPPTPRIQASAIYDPIRNLMLIFGGNSGSFSNEVWRLSTSGPATWAQLATLGTPPAGRSSHSAIYDPLRDRMLIFGGSSAAGGLNDIWSLSLADPATWTLISPAGTPPSPRAALAVYDPVRDQMLLYGGAAPPNDLWALSLSGTPTWTQLAPTGTPPSSRSGMAGGYDPIRDRLVIHGGISGNMPEDAWALELGAGLHWTALTPSGAVPRARVQASFAMQPDRDRLVMFGGFAGGAYLSETWTLEFSAALDVSPREPASRASFGRCYPSPARDEFAIDFALPRDGDADVELYDVAGRRVATLFHGPLPAGSHRAVWRRSAGAGTVIAPGIYLCALRFERERVVRRIALVH